MSNARVIVNRLLFNLKKVAHVTRPGFTLTVAMVAMHLLGRQTGRLSFTNIEFGLDRTCHSSSSPQNQSPEPLILSYLNHKDELCS